MIFMIYVIEVILRYHGNQKNHTNHSSDD